MRIRSEENKSFLESEGATEAYITPSSYPAISRPLLSCLIYERDMYRRTECSGKIILRGLLYISYR